MCSQDIYEQQIKTLVSLVQRSHATGGHDRLSERKLRDFVSFELIGRGTADVIARAMGELDDPEADRLNDIVTHCSQTFYQRDALWRAIAIPVAVCWHMKPHRIYVAKRGDHEYLKELAAGIKQCTGAKAVFLDPAIYSVKALFGLEARKLYTHLQSLIIGTPHFRSGTSGLPNMMLRSASEPPWRMVYFLGVEVQGPHARSRIDDPGVQDALHSYLPLGAQALTIPKSPIFDLGAQGETVCHPPLYLNDAVRLGEKAIRSYRLRQLLQEISTETPSVTLHCAFNALQYAVDILLIGAWLGFEMRWKLFAEETMEEFLRDAKLAVDAETAAVKCTLLQKSPQEFQKARKQSHVRACRPKTD